MAKDVKKETEKGLNVIAVVNKIIVGNLQPSTPIGNEVIMYGIDNLYPTKVDNIIRNSPTANGCVKRKAEFIFGLGVEGGDVVVNRYGETLNDVYNLVSKTYSKMEGFVLHFNTNVLGEIVEIQNVDIRYIRKLADLENTKLSKQKDLQNYDEDAHEIPIWNKNKKMSKNGFIYYFNSSGGIYPVCLMESSLDSAQFENESQIFTYMFAKNGFSGSGLLKLPNVPDDIKKKEAYEAIVKKVTDTRSAGSLLVVDAVINVDGEMDNSSMFESFMPTNVDKLYVNQKKQSKEEILTAYTMPEILLGVGSEGMFNMESFQDAFNYYNNDTSRDRLKLENSFNKFWVFTSFKKTISDIKVIPLDDLIKKEKEVAVKEDNEDEDG